MRYYIDAGIVRLSSPRASERGELHDLIVRVVQRALDYDGDIDALCTIYGINPTVVYEHIERVGFLVRMHEE